MSSFGYSALSFFCFLLLLYTSDARVVRLSNGLIDGVHVNDTGQETNVFLGVPYARPPVDSLRFQRAQSNWRWFGIQNATAYAPACIGTSELNKNKQRESEDCLYVDVYADAHCMNQTNCTVVFLLSATPVHVPPNANWTRIPGIAGRPSGGLVLVVPAYRQGIFGFADFGQSTGDAGVNLGLYDILHALNWTKREIHAFGGDPHRIVLIEDPSAAPLGQLLITSPVLDDELLAGAAILHQKLPLVREHGAQNATARVLERLGCLDSSESRTQWWWKTTSIREKVRCLRRKSADELAAAVARDDRDAFGPQVDGNVVPIDTLAGIIGNVKPIQLLLISPMEASLPTDARLPEECAKYTRLFGYESSEAVEACVRHYAQRVDGVTYVRNDVLNAIATEVGILTASVNSSTYLGFTPVFPHYTVEFFLNTTQPPAPWNATNGTATVAVPNGRRDQLHGFYTRFFTHLLHEFVRNGTIEHDWRPVDLGGANHYFISFQLEEDNATLKYAPTFYPEVYNQRAVRFWLKEVPEAEAEASDDGGDRKHDRTLPPWDPDWRHGGRTGTPEIRHRFHTTTRRQPWGTQTGSTPSTSVYSTSSSTYSTRTRTTTDYTPVTTVFSPLPTHPTRWITVVDHRPTRRTPLKGLPMFAQVLPQGAAGNPNSPPALPGASAPPASAPPAPPPPQPPAEATNGVSQVWSAFWAVLSLAIILAVILLIVSATKIVFRFQNSSAGRPRWSFRADEERKILSERPRHAAYESF